MLTVRCGQTLETQKKRRPQKNTNAQKAKGTDSQETSKRTTKPRLPPKETKKRRETRPQHKHAEPLGIKTKLKGVVQQLDIQKKLAKKAKKIGAPQEFPKPPTILSKAISTQERGKLDSSTSAIEGTFTRYPFLGSECSKLTDLKW